MLDITIFIAEVEEEESSSFGEHVCPAIGKK
jgi:hypothetical protein